MKKIILIVALTFCFAKFSYDSKVITNNESIAQPKVEKHTEKINITITMYYAVEGQCDNTPLVTACGYKINPKKASEQKWIAVSRDLLKKFKYGDKVRISNAGEKNGIYRVSDTMNKRYRSRVDILETIGTSMYKLTNAIIEKA